MTIATTTVERLYSTIARPGGPDAVMLLGAGASAKSGVPLSAELAERAAKWAYCRSHGRHPADPTVMRSDWLRWLYDHPWYRTDQGTADNYSAVIENLLQPREDRKDFLLDITRPDVSASHGYERLADLMAHNLIKTILTTNFDTILPDLFRSRPVPHHVSVIMTPADYTKLSTFPAYPQIVYLHGSVEHYTDKNLIDETQRLDDDLVERMIPLLRDHPLVVVGYRGAEPSVMRHLLIEQCSTTNCFRHGIYWCIRNDGSAASLHPLVHGLADAIGGNLQVIPIAGFDELMEQLWLLHRERGQQLRPSSGLSIGSPVPPAPTFDLQPIDGAKLEEIDWPLVQTQITAYCRKMALSFVTPVDRAWLLDRLCQSHLAARVNDNVLPRVAGYLLFARRASDRVQGAKVVVRLGGEQDRILEGNLWSQLEGVMDILAEVNRPFRLKGPVSETVYPYDPLALKELVVNALVHRRYDDGQHILIEVEPTYVRITNPGGLVDEVRHRFKLPIQEEIARGSRGVKAYRNPVVADQFYGAGAMDKAGSGLSDVLSRVNGNGGKVIFGPTVDNSAFEVTIYSRPEGVDEVTGTAAPLVTTARYVANVLEVVAVPQVVWHASTRAHLAREVWQNTGADWLPPFILHGGCLYSFSDLGDPSNPLRTQIDRGDLEDLSLDEFGAGDDGERHVVNLLNECLYRHLDRCGLIVDKLRKRAYFPRTASGPREISYQSRLRRATRTVTKPIVSKVTNSVRYWEHEALRFGFEKYGDARTLQVLPGYVFTMDGRRSLLEGPRVGPLATRRASRDYNPNVHNDLVFWVWTLSGGLDSFDLETGCEDKVVVRASLPAVEVRDVPTPADLEEPEQDARSALELEELQEELAELVDAGSVHELGEGDDADD